ncbi:MAG: hypothetical protein LBE47_03230, partial [Methanomassiliicoccaceae archaeon]|jgi:glycine dehydrogenase subunit 1|nr:hypothetical protein [Methanomassiliicoccaceae archaeon]
MTLLSKIRGVELVLDNVHFNEFVIRLSKDPAEVNAGLLKEGIMGGVPLKGHVNGMDDCMLIATTEMHTEKDYIMFADALRKVL